MHTLLMQPEKQIHGLPYSDFLEIHDLWFEFLSFSIPLPICDKDSISIPEIATGAEFVSLKDK